MERLLVNFTVSGTYDHSESYGCKSECCSLCEYERTNPPPPRPLRDLLESFSKRRFGGTNGNGKSASRMSGQWSLTDFQTIREKILSN